MFLPDGTEVFVKKKKNIIKVPQELQPVLTVCESVLCCQISALKDKHVWERHQWISADLADAPSHFSCSLSASSSAAPVSEWKLIKPRSTTESRASNICCFEADSCQVMVLPSAQTLTLQITVCEGEKMQKKNIFFVWFGEKVLRRLIADAEAQSQKKQT